MLTKSLQHVFVWVSENWRSGASDHPKNEGKKTGITRPHPNSEVINLFFKFLSSRFSHMKHMRCQLGEGKMKHLITLTISSTRGSHNHDGQNWVTANCMCSSINLRKSTGHPCFILTCRYCNHSLAANMRNGNRTEWCESVHFLVALIGPVCH